MDKNELMETIIRLTRNASDTEDVAADSSFMDDLEMSSMEILKLISELEEELNIRIPEQILGHVATVADMHSELCKITGSQDK